jgi:DNA-directed RNA polymerase specialized sigma24 family protein
MNGLGLVALPSQLAARQSSRPVSERGLERWGGSPRRAIVSMTTLDDRLYAWLTESDESRFQRAFNGYFALAFPAVVRHLARLSRWDAAELEELAQDALLRFFDRVGRRRREASEAIRNALTRVRPLELGAFHSRQVNAWTGDVASFREAVIRFRPTLADGASDADWKAAVRQIAADIPPLQGQGSRLLNAVQVELQWGVDPHESANADTSTEQAERLAQEVLAQTARVLAAEARLAGFMSFVDASWVAIRELPLLRVPTNGYLFEIAMTIYLDECKRRGRKKRGGDGLSELRAAPALSDPQELSTHPLEVMSMGPTGELDDEDSATRPAAARLPAAVAASSTDEAGEYEARDFLEKFYDYLRQPLQIAQRALEKAQASGRSTVERRRFESLAAKFERTVAVLSAMGEGFTQEEAADRLGLSRNQVKYVVELVQDAYERFCVVPADPSLHCVAKGAHTHEQ